uniref:VIgL family C1q-related protein 1 isoform 3 n=1 Tax=Littorina littorea TaxID=31216 RepID=A0A411DEQ5_LITLI|nr:VIgL family C1q-related protein 1 isoform 3 [Littorina littorea]
MFVLMVIFSLLFSACRGLQWSERLQDNAGPMEVCSGENIRLLWNYTLSEGERVKDMVWTCLPEGKATELLASYVDDTFVPMTEFSGRLSLLQDGEIELSCATILESGNYSFTVKTVDKYGNETPYRKTAWVKVDDTPKTQDGQLELRQEREAVRDDTSDRQWHVHLTCGHFFDLGQPAVAVEWKTPNGQTLSSSYFHKGHFHLLLSNPVKGGNYTCSLPSLSPATRCLPPGSALRDDVTVDVDEVGARFSVIEARQLQMQDDTKKENERLHDVIAELKNETETLSLGLATATLRDSHHSTENARLQAELNSVKNENGHHKGYINALQNKTETLKARLVKATLRVSFHAMLTSSFAGRGTIRPFTVITNEGDAFSGTTGIFTAPRNGTYFFVASAGTQSSGKSVYMSLQKDGVAVTRAYTRQYSGYTAMGSVQATLFLAAGQRVWLGSATAITHYIADTTSFSGFLIHAD